ncbi:hypothetical protein YTPLAS18_29100 [Nitrospira sp.]|nr:hypothetical protein YTPLAS18_29100 [Nitrospira sp.]
MLKVLEEMRVPIACIAGTSMGALVGGVYAAGVPLDQMTHQLGQIDWDDLFSDDPPRSEIPSKAKRDEYENLFRLEFENQFPWELGQRGIGVLLPNALTAGFKVEFKLREMVAQAGNFADQDFDDLPIPYRAVATDFESGAIKEFRRGDLVKAMRASMSVPGVLAPVEIDGVLYVDGGLVMNLPVASARTTCADVVIAVNLGSGLLRREELSSPTGILLQTFNVLTEQNVHQSLASLRPTDVLIEPQLGDFNAANFAEAMTLIPKGEAAARGKVEALSKFSVSDTAYRAWRESVAARLPVVPSVIDVRVATTQGRVNAEVIERELTGVPGLDPKHLPEHEFSLETLHKRLATIYGRGDFERLDYQVLDQQGSRTVDVRGVEKSWGPNYVRFGLGLASDSQQTRFNVSVSHRMTWINSLGAEWRNDLQLGFRKRLASEFYQPVSPRGHAFMAPRIELQDEPIVLFLQGRRIGEYRVEYARGHYDLGVQNEYGELRVGGFGGVLRAEEDFGVLQVIPNLNRTQVGYTGSATLDRIDGPQFERNGLLARVRTFGTSQSLGSQDNYNKTEVLVMAAKTLGDHSFEVAGYYGKTLYGDLPPYDPFLLGGFQRGSGYRIGELLGTEAALARGVYMYKVTSLPSVIGRAVYVGGSIEGTRATLGITQINDRLIRPSGSLFIGADTILGPVYVAYGQAFSEGGQESVYFLLGIP